MNFSNHRLLTLLLFSILMWGCASTKEVKKDNDTLSTTSKQTSFEQQPKTFIYQLKKQLESFEFNGEAAIDINGRSYNGNVEGHFIYNNTLVMNVFGPFGIQVARIEIKDDSLIIANLWHKKIYQTNLSINLFNNNLSLSSIARKFLLAEPLLDKQIDSIQKDTLEFIHSLGNHYISYTYDINNQSLNFKKIHIKDYKIKLAYSKYKKLDQSYYPYIMNITIPDEDIKLNFSWAEIKPLSQSNKFKPLDLSKLQKVDDFNLLFK